jgi:hypothetical protein
MDGRIKTRRTVGCVDTDGPSGGHVLTREAGAGITAKGARHEPRLLFWREISLDCGCEARVRPFAGRSQQECLTK